MKLAQLLLLPICVAGLVACGGQVVQAGSIPVGSSSLISTLDYSDTFTAYDFGGLEDRDGLGGYPLGLVDYPVNGTPGEGLAVENCYGNTQRYWADSKWSINVDSNVINGAESVYPGNSGGGSDTGITQTGGVWNAWGIEYGLSDRFVVQFDAVQNPGWTAIFFGGTPDTFWAADNVAILFRVADSAGLPEIGLFTIADEIYEVDTGLSSPIAAVNEWHNYAAVVDTSERTAELYVDEASVGTIDFDTVAGGVLASVPLVNTYVGAVYNGGDRMWSDNFQIGQPVPVPEPGVLALLLVGVVALFGVRRSK